jgi:hypothetical protein
MYGVQLNEGLVRQVWVPRSTIATPTTSVFTLWVGIPSSSTLALWMAALCKVMCKAIGKLAWSGNQKIPQSTAAVLFGSIGKIYLDEILLYAIFSPLISPFDTS